MDALVFPSKVDRWLAAVLLVGALVTLAGAGGLISVAGVRQWPVALGLVLLGAALPLWVLGSTYYVLTAAELHVRSGPFRWRIPLREIRAVEPTRSVLSSPALSLDRLRIRHGPMRYLMVSPREMERFLRELEARRAAAR